jgi:hypothetical protein
MKAKFVFLIFSIPVLFKLELHAQYRLFNQTDTFYLFKEYSYHLNLKNIDSSLRFLKLDLNTTDIEKISSASYNGRYDYAQFFIDEKKSLINVNLFDSKKQKIKTELYSFNNRITKTEELYFFNLSGLKKYLNWNTIETILTK